MTTEALFQEADTNGDGYLNENEFRTFLSRNSAASINVGNDFSSSGGNNAYGSSLYRSGSYETTSSTDALAGDVAYTGGEFLGGNYSSSGIDLSNVNYTNTSTVSGVDAGLIGSSSGSQSTSVVQQQYETDAQGNFKDSNPQIIRRPAQNGQMTYTQNIQVRFLQPPAVPPPGPLIVKEVRPPQPPLPAPLRIRQQAPPLPQQPPMILRERPPPKPAVVASQTVVRNLPLIPVPPRSVLIERIPPDPPKPRDIIIERWIPYGAQAERKTIVQRAEAAKAYPKPRNIIIQYDSPQVRVLRKFQRFGVTPENPEEYIRRYGASLFDTHTLLQQARAAGVVEDISVPSVTNSIGSSASAFSSVSAATAGGPGTDITNFTGIDGAAITGGSFIGGNSSIYESSSSSSTTTGAGIGAGASSYSGNNGLGGINALFTAADTNNDGVLSAAEFRNAGF